MVVTQAGDYPSCSEVGFGDPFLLVGEGTVSGGTATIDVRRHTAFAALETVYIDVNGDGVLSNGDTIWGADPNGPAISCVDYSQLANPLVRTFDWVADIVGGVGHITYTGPDWPF